MASASVLAPVLGLAPYTLASRWIILVLSTRGKLSVPALIDPSELSIVTERSASFAGSSPRRRGLYRRRYPL